MAASYYGVPRTTVDIDFLVHLPHNYLDGFLDMLDKFGLEVNRGRVKRQLRAGYNIISLSDKRSPHRADFIVQTVGKLENWKKRERTRRDCPRPMLKKAVDRGLPDPRVNGLKRFERLETRLKIGFSSY